MTTAIGFVSLISIYLYLPLTIYSGLLGSGIISKEEKDKTAEYLFTLPVNRHTVIGSKMFVAFANSLIMNVLVMGSVILTYSKYGVGSNFYVLIVNMSLGIFLTQIIFLGIGMVLSAVLKQYKKSGSISISILISTFMLSILISMVGEEADIAFLDYITPFRYFPSADMATGDFNLIFVFIAIAGTLAACASTFYFYNKRDLYI